MSKKNPKILLIISIILSATCAICLFTRLFVGPCSMFSHCTEYTNDYETRYFAFDPSTLQEMMEKQGEDIFTLLPDGDDYPKDDYHTSLQAENVLPLIKVLIEDEYTQSYDDMEITSILYYLHCDEIEQGVYEAWINYGGIDKQNDIKYFREFKIDFSAGFAEVFDVSLSPAILDYDTVNIDQNWISIAEVMRIAEDAIGIDFRHQLNNKCNLQLGIEGRQKEWEVVYYEVGAEWPNDIKIFINTKTGTIIEKR